LAELINLPKMITMNEIIMNYRLYKAKNINDRFITHEMLLKLLSKRKYIEIGKSVEERSINLLQYGNGEKKVMIWSQMHGNESTGTNAILDLLNLLEAQTPFSAKLLSKLTIQIIPMVNPDGTALYQRRNAINIDINRDFIKQQAPETRILKQALYNFSPNVCFNLHDQRRIFNVSGFKNPASISFLAPSEDKARTLTQKRKKTMGIISNINQILQQYAPNRIGRYSDEFYPNAFGDNLQKKGYSPVLIEAGGYPNDWERQHVRYLNWIALAAGLNFIASTDIFSSDYQAYKNIPQNEQRMLDKIFRGITIQKNAHKAVVDLGIMHEENLDPVTRKSIKHSKITQIGDLEAYTGYEEINAKGSMFYKNQRNYPILNEPADFELISI